MKNRKRTLLLAVLLCLLNPGLLLADDILTLDSSIEIALMNSVSLHSAREGIREATARKQEALTGFLPRFNTSYSYTRLNEAAFSKFQGLPAPFAALNGMEIPAGTKDNYNWSIEVTQPLFTGGGLLADYQAGKIGEEAAKMEETVRYQDVVRDVRIAYYDILRMQRIVETADKSVEMLTAHRDVALNFYKVGMLPKNDLLHAEVELANGRQSQVKARNALALAKARFNTVLRRGMSAPVRIVDDLRCRPYEKTLEECLAISLNSRPEIRYYTLKAAQAGKLVKAARSEYLPTLSLVGNYTRFGDHPSVSGSDYKDAENWYIMGVASWNFWEWGRTRHRVEAVRAKESRALDIVRTLQDQIALEIKQAYLRLQEAERQIDVSRKVIEQAEENFRVTKERFAESVATSTEVLDARTLLTKAESDYVNALGDFNISRATLQRAMGIVEQ